jgi:hypothetical protein
MIVQDKLAPLSAGIRKAKAINDVIETTLQQCQQIGSGGTFLTFSSFKKQMKLFFRKPIHPFDLLFLPQLYPVIRNFSSAALTMLPGRIRAPVKGAFIGITTVSLKVQF